MTPAQPVDRDRLASLMAEETGRFAREHPRSADLHARALGSLLEGVPMPWMVKWAGPFPPYVESASGASFRCVDGHEYVDFCLGDTGAMAGHGPAPTIAAVERQLRLGITHMLPTEDAAWVGEELTRRFGLPSWQFALSASDANRFSLRLARHISGRSKVVVHDHCYHGSVDEAIAELDENGAVVPVHGSVGPQVDVAETTRVVEFNDVAGLKQALEDRDVAAVLIEPALTNVGIVLPEPGYLDAVRDLTRRTGTLLIIDPTPSAPVRVAPPRYGAWIRTCSSSARRSVAASRSRPTGSRTRSARVSTDRSRSSIPMSAASAGPSRATPCRWRPRAPPWGKS